jgi:hypothetical protein
MRRCGWRFIASSQRHTIAGQVPRIKWTAQPKYIHLVLAVDEQPVGGFWRASVGGILRPDFPANPIVTMNQRVRPRHNPTVGVLKRTHLTLGSISSGHYRR